MTIAQSRLNGVGRLVNFAHWQMYLAACFLVYLAGFYLAPSMQGQQRWFYYTVTVIAVLMLAFKGRYLFADSRGRALKLLIGFILLLFLPFLWTPDADYVRTIRHGVERGIYVLAFATAVLVCTNWSSLVEKWIPRLLLTAAVIGLLLWFIKALQADQFVNLSGMLILGLNPNHTGLQFGVGALMALSLWLTGRPTLGRTLFLGGIAVLLAVGVYLTKARSAELGLLFAVALLFSLRFRSKWIMLLPIAALAVAVGFIFYHETRPMHYMLSGRSLIWQHIWDVFSANPLFGQGAETSYAVILSPSGAKLEAHSLYFGVAYYAGLFGLLVLAALYYHTIKRGRFQSQAVQWVYFPLLAYGLAVHLVEGIYPLYRPHPFWLFTWLPVLMLLLAKPKKESRTMKLPAAFDVFVIAMKREVERRTQITTMLQELGVDKFTFIDATDGKQADQLKTVSGYCAEQSRTRFKRELTPSEIACFDSHRRSWQLAAKANKPVLIIESDALIDTNTLALCEQLCHKPKPAWELVMLFYNECIPSFWQRYDLDGNHQLVRFANRSAFYASSLLVTPEGADRLVAGAAQFWLPADEYVSGGYIEKGLNMFAVYPPAASLGDLSVASNIEAERCRYARRKVKRNHLLKRLERKLRRFIYAIKRPHREL